MTKMWFEKVSCFCRLRSQCSVASFAGSALRCRLGKSDFCCELKNFDQKLFFLQVVELTEFNAIHQHGIFYDCVRSELIPLNRIRHWDERLATPSSATDNEFDEDQQQKLDALSVTTKRCVSKYENSASSSTWTIRMAIEEGDPRAREMLYHRYLRKNSNF